MNHKTDKFFLPGFLVSTAILELRFAKVMSVNTNNSIIYEGNGSHY